MSCDLPVGGSIQRHSPKATLIGFNRVLRIPVYKNAVSHYAKPGHNRFNR